jgi:hypothetical protein
LCHGRSLVQCGKDSIAREKKPTAFKCSVDPQGKANDAVSPLKGETGRGRAVVDLDMDRRQVFMRKIALQTATIPRKASLWTCIWREATPWNPLPEEVRTNRTLRSGCTADQPAKTASKRFHACFQNTSGV